MVKLDFSTTTAFKFLPAHATSRLLNWSAPASHSQNSQIAEPTLFCQLVVEQPQNIGLLLSPVFHYKVHQRHALEHFLLKSLSSRGVDVHFQAALCFKDGKDVRDQRPLLYPLGVAKPYVDAAAMEVDDDGVAIRQVKPHPGVQF